MARLLLVGCGKMGGAMLSGWLARGMTPADICIVEPDATFAEELATRFGVPVATTPTEIPAGFIPDVVVLAVKPQVMDDVLPAYQTFVQHGCVFLSIAAGRTIASFEKHLSMNAAIVRAMPNTPAAVARALSAAIANANVSDTQTRLCTDLLGAIGEVVWLDDETQMDAVTAVSGSGPAYVFLLAEVMSAAGHKAGLPKPLADQLARATVAGAGELLFQASEPASVLRQNVTSPGGTTAAALAVLMDDDSLQALFDQAILAASERSKALSG